jgi:hypothetical protein
MLTAMLLLVAAWLATIRVDALPCRPLPGPRVRGLKRLLRPGTAVAFSLPPISPEASDTGFPSGFT